VKPVTPVLNEVKKDILTKLYLEKRTLIAFFVIFLERVSILSEASLRP
jgi:hypothetical protein